MVSSQAQEPGGVYLGADFVAARCNTAVLSDLKASAPAWYLRASGFGFVAGAALVDLHVQISIQLQHADFELRGSWNAQPNSSKAVTKPSADQPQLPVTGIHVMLLCHRRMVV